MESTSLGFSAGCDSLDAGSCPLLQLITSAGVSGTTHMTSMRFGKEKESVMGVEKNIRVVLVSFSELPTMQKYLYYTYEELRSQAVEAWTLGSASLAIDMVTSERNWLVETPDSPRPSVESIKAARDMSRELASRIAAVNPDVVHFVNKHTWNYFLIRALRKTIPDVHILHTFHDPIGHEGDSIQRGVVLYHKVVQRMLDGIVVHSSVALEQAKSKLRPKCSVFQVPLGVVRWIPYDGPCAGRKEALIFGRINSYKGVKLYPQILRRINELDPEVRVVIAGKPANDIEPALLNEVSSQPNAECHYGFIEEQDLDAYFSQCSIVLMPYTSITQSGVVLDAYSHSRCVVAFDIEGIRQYVPDPSQLVSAFDCDLYAKRIVSLLNDSESLCLKAHDSWKFGKEHYAPESMANELLRVYEEVTDDAGR